MKQVAGTTVYIADLRHDFSGALSVDAMPLGIGYMKAIMDRELAGRDTDVRIFAYPDDLLDAIDDRPPDIQMVSNYMWNEALGHFVLGYAKRCNPNVLTVMGGPNISEEPERQIAYVAAHPEIDVYICGEADFVSSELVEMYLDSGKSVADLAKKEIPSSIYRRNGELVRTEILPRRRTLDDIPSPYLSGVMDHFFDGKLAPMIETNRGCPFRCKFCVQGTVFYNKVNHFELPRLNEEIRYIAQRIYETCPSMGTLRIADPNFGMYKRDVQISEFIGAMQAEYGWPTFIDATTGKNKPERILECLEKVNGALVLYQAVQSLDDEVLRNIDRSYIKLSSYEKIMIHVRGRGLRSNSDLILGLPGESLESHLRGLYKLIDAGTDQAHCFQAMVLKGSDLETLELREQYEFMTRFRVLPKNYGVYRDEKVFDIEEIIVGSDTLPFEDYLQCRKHHVVFSIFWNDSWFDDVVQLVQRFGVSASDWLKAMLEAVEADGGAVKRLLDEFIAETENELFPTLEECRDFYAEDEIFERLRRGEIGDNLMYKYRARASFFEWKEVCATAMMKTRKLLLDHGVLDEIAEFEEIWPDFHRYIEAKHASGTSPDEIVAPVEATLSYDIKRWIGDGFPIDVARYRFESPHKFEFRLNDEGERELAAALRVWTAQLMGLTKLVTRIRVSSQVREPYAVEASSPVLT